MKIGKLVYRQSVYYAKYTFFKYFQTYIYRMSLSQIKIEHFLEIAIKCTSSVGLEQTNGTTPTLII